MKPKILKIKKVILKNNILILFRNLKINLSKGEVYFSIFKNIKDKDFKRNDKATQHFFVLNGEVVFDTFDPKYNNKKIFKLNQNDNKVLLLPPKYWYKICPKKKKSILFNQTNLNKKISKKYDQNFKNYKF